MKIITWNVNGLRAVLNKGALEWVLTQEADVVCLQEIKARPDQLSQDHLEQFNGYQTYWNPADRPGYSGVVSLTRNEPAEVQNGIGLPEFDTEGRVVRSRHPGFLLYNIYFPNGGRGLERLAFKLKFYATNCMILVSGSSCAAISTHPTGRSTCAILKKT